MPVVNPLFDPKCPIGNLCQPYINTSAFEEAPGGQLGNAPRTFDNVRGPWQQTPDLSVQKNFQITEKIRVQFRVDALNALNHPIFRVPVGAGNNASDIWGGGGGGANLGLRSGALSMADYNSRALANHQPVIPAKPAAGDPGTALLKTINDAINKFRLPPPDNSINGGTSPPLGRLPADFFTVRLPPNFNFTDVNSFDIRTVEGFKLYRVRQDLGPGTGGRLIVPPQTSRYLQFGLRILF